MSMRSAQQKIGRACRVIVVAAAMLAPLVASSASAEQATPVSAASIVEIVRPRSHAATCALLDAQLERARTRIAEAQGATEGARARLVRDRLRVMQYPTAMLDTALEDEAFNGNSAELRAAREDMYQTQVQLGAAGCDATERPAEFVDVKSAVQRTVVTSAPNR